MKSRWIWILAVALVCAQPYFAQEDAPTPADETEAAMQEEAAEGEDAGKTKIQNGLYVEVGGGTNSMQPLDTTLRTSSASLSVNTLEFEDMDYRRAAIGWRLPGIKGSFRLQWEGFNETGYDFLAAGRLRRINGIPAGATLDEGLDWWILTAVDGALTATQAPPAWTFADDANGNSAVEREEVRYPVVTFTNSINIESDLQNRVQVADIVYGRTYGPRRVEGTWWGGLRYFAYEGTLLQGAWLRGGQDQFTDGEFLRLLHPVQDSSGFGPVGSMGFQVNFFDKRLQLFAAGKAAFVVADVKTDTGLFFTLVDGVANTQILTSPARLQTSRSRTSWHTHVEGGVRVNLKMGLVLEVSYFKGGFLDAVLTPTEIRIPANFANIPNGTSAFFATQDLRFDGWRSSLAFQF